MRKLSVFNHITLDGYFTDKNNDMSWAHRENDAEMNSFIENNAKGESEMLFGRLTYEMMASFWPTAMAQENMPVVAKTMNESPKVVFSRTLKDASWSNTRLFHGDLVNEVRRMKSTPGKDMIIFGSGSIVSQLAQVGLIDQYQVVLNPLALGAGRTMFAGLEKKLALKLISSRVFKSGCVFLTYEPWGR